MMMWNAGWMPMLIFSAIMLAVMAVVMIRGFRTTGRGMPFYGPSRADRVDGRLGGTGDEPDEDPLVILRERYARGEIDHVEFESTLDGLLHAEHLLGTGRPEGEPR